jgi:hypothetical protein
MHVYREELLAYQFRYCTQRAFRREYGVRDGSDRKTILRLVEKLEETGSLQREKGKNNLPSRVPQCSEDVRE